MPLSLQKFPKENIIQAKKIKEETNKQSCIKVKKMPILKHYKSGSLQRQNQSHVFIKVFLCVQSPFACQEQRGGISK